MRIIIFKNNLFVWFFYKFDDKTTWIYDNKY